jgi:hypothetical protein
MKTKIKQRERGKEKEMGERNESDEGDDETGPGERGKSRCLGQFLCFARRRFRGLFSSSICSWFAFFSGFV